MGQHTRTLFAFALVASGCTFAQLDAVPLPACNAQEQCEQAQAPGE